MRRNRIVHVLAAAALALGLAAAARAAGSAPGGTLVIGLDQEPPTLDPHASPSAATFQIILNVTESLVHQGVDGKIVPWLAAGYTVSPDGKSFVFNLRKDVTFSDGSPLNAAAVKWNLDRIVDPNFKAGGALLALTRYAGSAVVDDSTVRVEFKTPYAPFLAYAAAGTLAMLSPKATAAQGAAAGRQPVGSGPFVVSEWAARDHITLARNPLYARRAPWSNHQGPPYLDRVVWRIIPETGTRAVTIQSGETQMITLLGAPGSVLAGLRSDPALRIESVPYPGSSRLLALNAKRPPTDDLRVRRAINYGVNRAAFFDSIYKGLGTPACAPIDQVLLRDPDACAAYPYNPARAAGLLDEAGWKMGPNNIRERDGKPLSFVINSLTYGGGNFPEIELLQGQLLALGFDATIKTQAQAPWYEDNYHCADNGRTFFLRTNDPDLLSALFESTNIGGNFNWFCYANPEVDRLLTAGREEFNPAKRRAIYLRIERIVTDDAVSMPLVDILQVWAIRNTVTGTKYNYLTYPALSDVRVK